MAGPVLYSTNPYLKFLIAQEFLGDVHYAWCGETFDSTKQSAYSRQALVAPSSDPCAIYKQLQADCARKDRHSAKIGSLKASLEVLTWSSRCGGVRNLVTVGDMIDVQCSSDIFVRAHVTAITNGVIETIQG
jgi:hypothetical protein